jgi:hypothetical protein
MSEETDEKVVNLVAPILNKLHKKRELLRQKQQELGSAQAVVAELQEEADALELECMDLEEMLQRAAMDEDELKLENEALAQVEEFQFE